MRSCSALMLTFAIVQRVVSLLLLEGAMNSIDWRSTILRWSAVAFSLGAWAGIALVVRQLLG